MRSRRTLLAVVAVATCLLLAASAGAATPAPQWTTPGRTIVLGHFADAAAVVLDDGSIRLFYAHVPDMNSTNDDSTVYSVISHDDGKTWQQEPGKRLGFGVWPDVVRLPDGTWRMYYQDLRHSIVSAHSDDGLTFTPEDGERISQKPVPQVDSIGGPSVIRLDDGTWLMTFFGQWGEHGMQASLYWATSPDGLAWTVHGSVLNPANISAFGGPFLDSELVRWDDGTVRLYLSTNAGGIYRIDYTGSGFTQNATLAMNPGMLLPADPTLAHYGGTWHLFYGIGPGQSVPWGIYEAKAAPVAVAAPSCVVPRVTGKKLAAAKAKLAAAGCSVGTVTRKRASRPAGTVLAQKPVAGAKRAAHAKVSLVVSKGP